jgi:hypothetical protein
MRRLGVACLLLTLIGGAATAAPLKGGGYTEVASGTLSDGSWHLDMKGTNHRRCYRLSVEDGFLGHNEIWCGKRTRPRRDWRPLMKLVTNGNTSTVQVDETSPRVREMKLRLGPKPARTLDVQTARLSDAEAASAGLAQNFRFAAYSAGGPFCVERVALFDAAHERVGVEQRRCRVNSP